MASVDGSKSLQMASTESFPYQCNPCDYDGTKREAFFYCQQCKDYLCESCNVVHQKFSSTRKHHVVSGSLMPSKREDKSLEEDESKILCSCSDKFVTEYCKDHNDIICVDCKTLKHRKCVSSTIAEASTGLKTTMIDSINRRIQKLKEKLTRLQKQRMEDADSLDVQAASCREKAENFQKELIQHVTKITEKSLKDIDDCANEQKVIINQHVITCSMALGKLDVNYKPFEEASSSKNKSLVFVRNIQLKKIIDHVEHMLREIGDEIKRPSITFSCDETLRRTNTESLGVVKSTPSKICCPNIAEMNIKSITKVDVKFPSDQKNPWIAGSNFMPNDELVLCDVNNHSIKVLNTDISQKEQISISSWPWDICLMNPEEIVVTQPDAKSLLFVKVIPKLQICSSVSLDQKCWGVAVKDDLIYVSFNNGEVRLLGRNGQQKTSVFDTFRFQLPHYIHITETGVLYVSEHNGNSIRIIKDGKEVSNFQNVGLQYPLGLLTDGGENVLVCEYQSNNLKIIDKTGQQVKILLSSKDGLDQPYTISFRSYDSTLVIGCRRQAKLIVCKLVDRKRK